MASDMDRLVELIADRVKARLGGAAPNAAPPTSSHTAPHLSPHTPLREVACNDAPSTESCSGCGMCASRRPWSVRAIKSEGACRVGAGVDVGKVDTAMAGMIDHTLLKAD